MKIKFLSAAAFGTALSLAVMTAQAQKSFTQGTISMSTSVRGMNVQFQEYFTPDSTAITFAFGPAKIKILADAKNNFFAQVVDVSAFNVKKAAIYTPDEIEQVMNSFPAFTFAPGTETKQISGFNCKKVVATDTKTKKTYDVWVTNDVSLPASANSKYYAGIGGTPIQYTSFQKGQDGQLVSADVIVTSITDQKAPAGTFIIPADFDKISKDDMDAMQRQGGGR
jgi:hypothetical protein